MGFEPGFAVGMFLGAPSGSSLGYSIIMFLGLALGNCFRTREGYIVRVSLGTLGGFMIGTIEVSFFVIPIRLPLG